MPHLTLQSIALNQPSKQVNYPDLELMSFPGGERHVRLPDAVVESGHQHWTIHANLYTPADIMDLLLLTDALRRVIRPGSQLHLVMPYVPYARQDRVALDGEPLSIQVFCRLINGLGFDSVEVWDPHSDVTPALLNNVWVVPTQFLMSDTLRQYDATHLLSECAFVAPDAGARKRVMKLAQEFSTEVVFADKVRDPATGALSGAAVAGDLPDKPLLLVDDLCDGGGTFIALAKVLREKTQKPLYLYVTHGLFTKGLEPLKACFTKVFAANCKDPALAAQLG